REIEPRERQAAALDGSRAERLLSRALHADVRVALECHITLGSLQVGARVGLREPTVLLVIPVDLLRGRTQCRWRPTQRSRAGAQPPDQEPTTHHVLPSSS